jgi:hypothetical protein
MATAENAAPTACYIDITYQRDWNTLRATEYKRHWWSF